MSQLEVQTYALSDLNTGLRKFLEAVNEEMDELLNVVSEESSRLQGIRDARQREVIHCEQALRSCESYVDEDGNHATCYCEREALNQARQKLDQIRAHITRFHDATQQSSSHLRVQDERLENSVGDAREMLERLIQSATSYLRDHPEMIGDVAGWDQHGREYLRARREFLRRVATGEHNENYGPDIAEWARRDQMGGGTPHTPPGLDVAHTVAGINIPEVLSLGDLHANRSQGSIGRHHHLPRTEW